MKDLRCNIPWRFVIALLPGLLCLYAPATAAAAAANDAGLRQFEQTRFIAYTPRSFHVVQGRTTSATAEGIRSDLALLRPWFDGIITYSFTNGMERVPQIARELGYRHVLAGIWDPVSNTEIDNAFQELSQPESIVMGLIIGNEGLYAKRYGMETIRKRQDEIRKRHPGLLLTTSEPFFYFFKEEYHAFFASQTILAPNIHPVFEPWFRPELVEDAVKMVVSVTQKLQAAYPNRMVLIKETGMPSGPGRLGLTPERQMQFWRTLQQASAALSGTVLAYFEAFDEPWKPAVMAETYPGDHSIESFWGFFDTQGNAKPVTRVLSPNVPKKVQKTP
jgi:exo-beta-1,3-glucanase (GH17 family)